MMRKVKKAEAKAKPEFLSTGIPRNGLAKGKELWLGSKKLGVLVRIPSEWRVIVTRNGVTEEAIEAPLARTHYAKEAEKVSKEVFGLKAHKITKPVKVSFKTRAGEKVSLPAKRKRKAKVKKL